MGRSETFQWFSQFKAGRISTDDDEHPSQPVSSLMPEMIERVRQIICEDRRLTIDEVSMLVRISNGTCHKILTFILWPLNYSSCSRYGVFLATAL